MAKGTCVALMTSSRTEGLFVGGSSGSALSGALRYLHSEKGSAIASDQDANVVVILPDGVRNYMSKPWFLDVATDEASEGLRRQIRCVIGRDLRDATKVVEQAAENGTRLQVGEGLNGTPGGMTDEATATSGRCQT